LTFVSRVESLPATNTFSVDVVLTGHPERYPSYRRVAVPLDSPIGAIGPLAAGEYSVRTTVRSAEGEGYLGYSVCSGPDGHQPQITTVTVRAEPGPTVTLPVVEFYNSLLDHYFVTQDASEIADLDEGIHPGWVRTGESFVAFTPRHSDLRGRPVARSYGRPSAGLDTHFFTASGAERFLFETSIYGVDWLLETTNAFEIALPDLLTGTCPVNTQPIYRLWNRRQDSNHRYAASTAIKQTMIARGWAPEGYGPDAVVMCAPG